jgi:hypothetical protein
MDLKYTRERAANRGVVINDAHPSVVGQVRH